VKSLLDKDGDGNLDVDKDGDGKVSLAEFRAMHDADGDGKITLKELRASQVLYKALY
jgi:Ca2+-binding EF-hand superfamily protein